MNTGKIIMDICQEAGYPPTKLVKILIAHFEELLFMAKYYGGTDEEVTRLEKVISELNSQLNAKEIS